MKFYMQMRGLILRSLSREQFYSILGLLHNSAVGKAMPVTFHT